MRDDIESERRRVRRAAVAIAAVCRERGKTAIPALILDLTTHGSRLTISHAPKVGSYVWLKLPQLEARYSRVAWVKGGVVGLAFEEPLHVAVLDKIAGRCGAGGHRASFTLS
jgi:hypothetical protein